MATFMDKIDWPKFTKLINAKIGALRLAAEKFPDGPAKAAYVSDVFAPVFGLLAEFMESTGGAEQWGSFSDAEVQMLADHATAPLGTAFPAELTVKLYTKDGRVGEG